jgi:hypothetical protein
VFDDEDEDFYSVTLAFRQTFRQTFRQVCLNVKITYLGKGPELAVCEMMMEIFIQ